MWLIDEKVKGRKSLATALMKADAAMWWYSAVAEMGARLAENVTGELNKIFFPLHWQG